MRCKRFALFVSLLVIKIIKMNAGIFTHFLFNVRIDMLMFPPENALKKYVYFFKTDFFTRGIWTKGGTLLQ